MRRVITLNGHEFLATIGRSYVKVQLMDRRSLKASATAVAACHEVAGVTPDTFERGQWKRTRDGVVTPGRIAFWIRKNLWRFTDMKNERTIQLRDADLDEVMDFAGYWGCDSDCGLRIYTIREQGGSMPVRYVVVMTQLQDSKGTSVTNAVEIISTEVQKRFLPTADPEKIVWIEHWPPHGAPGLNLPESYDRVFLRFDGKQFRLDESVTGHGWKRLREADLEEIGILG